MKFSTILKEFLEENYKLTPLDIRILKRIHNEYIKEGYIHDKNAVLYDILKEKLYISDLDSIIKYIRLFTFNYRENGDYENIDNPIIKHIVFPNRQMALANHLDIPPELLLLMSYNNYGLMIYEDMTTNNVYSIGTEDEANKAASDNIKDYIDDNKITGWNINFIKQFIIPNKEWVKDESADRARMDIDEMDIDDIITEAGLKSKYDSITEMIDELRTELEETQNEDEKINIKRKINSYVKEQDNIELNSDEIVFNERKNYFKEEIESDILNYLEEYYGDNDYDKLYNKKIIGLDIENLIDAAIAVDGRGHYLNPVSNVEKEEEYNNIVYYIYDEN
jgi:hypothetical protein